MYDSRLTYAAEDEVECCKKGTAKGFLSWGDLCFLMYAMDFFPYSIALLLYTFYFYSAVCKWDEKKVTVR